MPVTETAPAHPRSSRPYTPRHNWTPLLTSLASAEAGVWLSVPLDEIPGQSTVGKQVNLSHVARRRFGRVQTQTENGQLFIRRLAPTETK